MLETIIVQLVKVLLFVYRTQRFISLFTKSAIESYLETVQSSSLLSLPVCTYQATHFHAVPRLRMHGAMSPLGGVEV
jgi:hypothetical protein